MTLKDYINECKKSYIELTAKDLLKKNSLTMVSLARALDIGERTCYRMLSELGIDLEALRNH